MKILENTNLFRRKRHILIMTKVKHNSTTRFTFRLKNI